MKKYLLVLFVSTSLLAQEIAIVKFLKGEATLFEKSTTKSLKEGSSIVEANTTIETREKSSATIVFSDTSVLVLGEMSKIDIKKYVFNSKEKSYGFELYLKNGSATFDTGDISKAAPKSFLFETPQGKVSIKEGKFALKVD